MVNGVCQVGNCSSPDVVSSGNSASTYFNFTVTLANSDQYKIVGAINSSAGTADAPGFSVVSPFSVIYKGNPAGTPSPGT